MCVLFFFIQRWPSQPRLFRPEGTMSVMTLYTSPSLPNITLGLSANSSPLSVINLFAHKTTTTQKPPTHVIDLSPHNDFMALDQYCSEVSSVRSLRLTTPGISYITAFAQQPQIMQQLAGLSFQHCTIRSLICTFKCNPIVRICLNQLRE